MGLKIKDKSSPAAQDAHRTRRTRSEAYRPEASRASVVRLGRRTTGRLASAGRETKRTWWPIRTRACSFASRDAVRARQISFQAPDAAQDMVGMCRRKSVRGRRRRGARLLCEWRQSRCRQRSEEDLKPSSSSSVARQVRFKKRVASNEEEDGVEKIGLSRCS